jgi:hypothetical protein
MSQSKTGNWVTQDDYLALKEKHDAFLRDVRRVFDDLSCASTPREGFDPDAAITDAVDNLEAAFMAAATQLGFEV